MGKLKKKQDNAAASKQPAESAPALSRTESVPEAAADVDLSLPPVVTAEAPVAAPPAPPKRDAQPPSRLRRWLPDLVKVAVALAFIGVAAAIWYKPPLTLADFPYVSYQFEGRTFTDARLLRPLAMPTRYYIRLPKKLADRYEWFAVDRRREVAALAIAPPHHFLGLDAIKRSDPLGLDLEFRKMDHSEWQVHFLPDAIVFSNAVIAVRMDAKPAPPPR